MQQWNTGFDIGAAHVRAAMADNGLTITKPSAVALRKNQPVALGDEALAMLGRTPPSVAVGFPMRAGTVSDETMLRAWIWRLLRQCAPHGKARVLIACPARMPIAARRLIGASVMEAGALACAFVRVDVVSALGAYIDISAPECALCADLGAETMSCTLFAGGRILFSDALPYGARAVDEAVMRAVRAKYGLLIGPNEAEDLKRTLAGLSEVSQNVQGMDAENGFPGARDISGADIAEAAEPVVNAMAALCARALDHASAQCVADLMEKGVKLTGGGARMYGLVKRISEETGLPCAVAEDPENCSARGLAEMLKVPGEYEHLIEPFEQVLAKG